MTSLSEYPTVSVIIPVYNTGPIIEDTLRSVANQTHRALDIVIVDDCSTDDSAQIIHSIIEGDSRFRYFRLERNSNLPAVPRNFGIEKAYGKYVAFLDHDDLWLRRKVERQLMVLESQPEVVMVHSALVDFPDRISMQSILRLPAPSSQATNADTLRRYNRVQCSSVMMRRDTLLLVGGFDESRKLRAIEDYELWLRVSAVGTIRYISEIQGFYRTSSASTYSQEDAKARLAFLLESGRVDKPEPQSILTRGLRRGRRIPAGLYCHLVEGPLRGTLGIRPRVT